MSAGPRERSYDDQEANAPGGRLRPAAWGAEVGGSGAASTPAGATNQNVAADPSEFKSTAGGGNLGVDVQRTVGAGGGYTFGPAAANFVYTHSQYQNTSASGLNPTSGSTHFDNYELHVKYPLTPRCFSALWIPSRMVI